MIAEHLEMLSRNELENLMVFAPPRHGKSEQVAIRFPAWELLERPAEHYIATAYGDELAATFSRACRNTIKSPSYQRLKPHKFKASNDTKWELVREEDDQRATYISSGILSALTGEGATRLIIDDPVKNAEEAYSKKIRDKIDENYRTAASTRLQPSGRKAMVMTRWHEDDLAGRLLARAVKDKTADQWTVLVFAAINDDGQSSYKWDTRTGYKEYFPSYDALWKQAFPRDALDGIKANLGNVYWNALYMQRPTTPGGEIFKRDNWGWYDARPQVFDGLVMVVDGACEEGQENDYSAMEDIAIVGTKFPILGAWRDKVTFPKLMAKVYERWEEAGKNYGQYPDRLVVENKASGIQLAQQLDANNMVGVWTFPDGETRRVPPIPIVRMPAQQSKVLRAQGISGYHESKLVQLPRGAEWVEDFVDEHALFPKGVNDDWVDCTVHGISYFTRPSATEEHEIMVVSHETATIDSELDEMEFMQQFSRW